MYNLKNGEKIDDNGICRAMANSSVLDEFYFDKETGKVIFICISFDSDCSEILDMVKKDKKRYLRIPKVPDEERYSLMKDFVKEMIGDEKLKAKLNFILEKGQDFYLFERILDKDGDGWIHGWVQWKYNYFIEEVAGWLDDLNIGIEEESWYFDDCPVCQFMKEMEEKGRAPKLKEMKKVFEKANQKNFKKLKNNKREN